jgi:hypothetical protein
MTFASLFRTSGYKKHFMNKPTEILFVRYQTFFKKIILYKTNDANGFHSNAPRSGR